MTSDSLCSTSPPRLSQSQSSAKNFRRNGARLTKSLFISAVRARKNSRMKSSADCIGCCFLKRVLGNSKRQVYPDEVLRTVFTTAQRCPETLVRSHSKTPEEMRTSDAVLRVEARGAPVTRTCWGGVCVAQYRMTWFIRATNATFCGRLRKRLMRI